MDKNDYLNNSSVKDFIKWIEIRLDKPMSLNHSFHMKKLDRDWECDSLYSAYEQYCWPFSFKDGKTGNIMEGIDFDSSYDYLSNISFGLKKGLQENNHEDCINYCLLILGWGGVSNRNDIKIKTIGDKICEYLIYVKNRLESEMSLDKYYTSQIGMNSGFTKIYSSYIDDFIMYDGRVGAALGYLVRMFCEENRLGKVPDELAFAWGRGKEATFKGSNVNRRNPSRGYYKFPELMNNSKRHLANNIRANWLLRGILDSTQSKFNELDNRLQLTALQSSLFMIGYDVIEVNEQESMM